LYTTLALPPRLDDEGHPALQVSGKLENRLSDIPKNPGVYKYKRPKEHVADYTLIYAVPRTEGLECLSTCGRGDDAMAEGMIDYEDTWMIVVVRFMYSHP
jgi:hypothetical protein